MSSTDTAIVVKQFESNLATLVQRSAALAVVDADTCRAGKELQKEWKGYIDRVGFELDPGIGKAKELFEHLRDQKKRFTDPAKAQMDSVRARVDGWTAQERAAAQREQDRINEENARKARQQAEDERRVAEAEAAETRKSRVAEIRVQLKCGEIGKREAARLLKLAGADEEAANANAAAAAEEAAANPPQIQVKPNIPSVAGTKNQVYYFAEPRKPALILFAYDEAIRKGDKDRAAFLSQFIMVDEQAVSAFARKTKDNEKATAQVPGFHFYSKG